MGTGGRGVEGWGIRGWRKKVGSEEFEWRGGGGGGVGREGGRWGDGEVEGGRGGR